MSQDLPPGITIRRGTPEDVDGFRDCLDAIARERRWLGFLKAPSRKEILGFLLRERPIQFLAEEEGWVVGWCDVTPDTREGFRHQGILGIGVLPDFRRRGIGRALLGRTVRAGLESGLIRIELEVFASNGRAIRMYERAGFQVEGRKRFGRVLDGEVEDVVIMALLKPEGG